MRILGISAFYHDSAAALVVDGEIVAAAQEERFTRKKHDAAFPSRAIEYCLSFVPNGMDGIDHVVYYEKPFLKFERLLETYLAFAPRGLRSFQMALPLWLREKLFQKRQLEQKLSFFAPHIDWPSKLLFTEHHQAHAASAFFASPFDEAVVLTMDGVGEWTTTSVAIGKGSKLEIVRELHFPHSLGLLYSAFTYYNGFQVNSGEYKLMGLAPYGEPKYKQLIFEQLVDVKPDGSFRLDMAYFNYCTGLTMTNQRFDQLFGHPARRPEQPLTQFHMDVAASIQSALDDIMLRLTRSLRDEFGLKNLCLAGGVALNCVANGKILRDGHFEGLWIQPASGDAGGALGAALAATFQQHQASRRPGDRMHGSYLGPAFTQSEIEQRLQSAGAVFDVLSEEDLLDVCAEALASEQALGWFQGRMEFGPRALGNRSILADARSPRMQSTLNLKVKYRESFRPFAPAVLAEYAAGYFDLEVESPYMLLVAEVLESRRRPMTQDEQQLFGIARLNVPRSTIPAVTHVDYSARVQTVHDETNPIFHALLSRFHQKTGSPVLVNTSFNVRGEPIVCSPEDAFLCFMGCEIEALAVGRCFLRKEAQNPALRQNYENAFALD